MTAMKPTTPKEKALAKVRAAQKKADIVSKAFGPPPAATQPSGNVATSSTVPTVVVQAVEGESFSRTKARRVLKNDLGSALVMSELVYGNSELEVLDLCAVLRERGEDVERGDLAKLLGTLGIQAIVLDGIFTNFARRAAMAKTNDELERYLRIAMKAQSQCRTTVESIAVTQQGPAIFAKNANINNGQQQVNNGVPAPAAPKALEASPAAVLQPVPPRARKEKTKVTNQTIGAPR